MDLAYIYVSHILAGIKDAWCSKKEICWGKVFEFIQSYIGSEKFWLDEYKTDDDLMRADHKWVVGEVAELIKEGTRDDAWAFGEKHLENAKKIIFVILERLQSDKVSDNKEFVSHALNSAMGKILSAFVNLALRIARLRTEEVKNDDVRWSDDLKKRFDELLCKDIIESYVILGQYLPNFTYLDNSWTLEKIKKFEKLEDDTLWLAFISGYISINVYPPLFFPMRNHYKKALSILIEDSHLRERLIQHIAIGYLNGWEDLSGDLFKLVLNERGPDDVQNVIGFFWEQKDYLISESEEDIEMRKKIIAFWNLLYMKYKDTVTRSDAAQIILSDAARLAVFLPEIDKENVEWLALSAEYVQKDFNAPIFIEYLDMLKDKGDRVKSGNYVADIFLGILENYIPDYDEKHIKSIVEYLYGLGDQKIREKADIICNTYGKNGSDLLRKIWEKNQDKQNRDDS